MLKRLLGQNRQRYATLTAEYSYEDNVVFHLKQLLAKGLVEKSDQRYAITTKGVKVITEYDLPDLVDVGCKKFRVGFLCQYKGSYLLKEHPAAQANFYNLPSGGPRFGERVEDALVRTFAADTGVTLDAGAFSFYSLHLKTVKTSSGEVLFDDAFAIYAVSLDASDYARTKLAKPIFWADTNTIASLPNRWPELDLCILQQDTATYRAYEFTSDYTID